MASTPAAEVTVQSIRRLRGSRTCVVGVQEFGTLVPCRQPRLLRDRDLRENKRARYKGAMSQIILEDFNLEAAERRLCLEALARAGNIVGAAEILGITRHAMKRRITKLRLAWPLPSPASP